MGGIFLLVFGAVSSLAIIGYVIKVVYQARGSRPVIVELIPSNTEKSAKTVELSPYIEHICNQFPETLSM